MSIIKNRYACNFFRSSAAASVVTKAKEVSRWAARNFTSSNANEVLRSSALLRVRFARPRPGARCDALYATGANKLPSIAEARELMRRA